MGLYTEVGDRSDSAPKERGFLPKVLSLCNAVSSRNILNFPSVCL